jgi:hypothetical protein
VLVKWPNGLHRTQYLLSLLGPFSGQKKSDI